MTERSKYPEKWTDEERVAWKADYLAGKPVELPTTEHIGEDCAYCDALAALMREADEDRAHAEQLDDCADDLRKPLDSTTRSNVNRRGES